MSYEFLYDEESTEEEVVVGYQALIDSGDAWRLEGHVGRMAMGLIEAGKCMLGEKARHDYWGNRVPSRYEVKAGTKGSQKFVEDTQ